MSHPEDEDVERAATDDASRESEKEADAVAHLLELAGPPAAPPPVPDAVRQRLRAHGRRVWQEALQEESSRGGAALEGAPRQEIPRRAPRRRAASSKDRPWYRRAAAGRLAAALVVVAGLAVITLRPGLDPADIEPIGGSVATLVAVFPADGSGYVPDQAFEVGTVVTTAQVQRLALRLADGTSVRLDAGSELELVAPRGLRLRQGALYVDSRGEGATVTVHTPYGDVRDIGTQFEVRLLPEALRVQVREGEVEVAPGGDGVEEARHRAAAGTALTIGIDGVESLPLAGDDESWDWVVATAPPFDMEGRSLGEFLTWVHREMGWSLRFASPQLERRAAEITVHGRLDGMRPDEALDLVVPGSGLRYRVTDGVLWIEP